MVPDSVAPDMGSGGSTYTANTVTSWESDTDFDNAATASVGTLSSATAWFEFEAGYRWRSYDAVGDYDGDGLADVAVGWEDYDATEAGDQDRVYVFDGPVSGPRSPADADRTLEGSGDPSYAENHNYFVVAALGDFDGDGRDDLAVGNRVGGNALAESAGSVFVLPGPLPASGSLVDAPTWLLGAVERASLGSCVAGPGDVDGDGHAELLATAGISSAGTGSVAHLVHGPQSGTLIAEEAGATLDGDFYPTSCAGYRRLHGRRPPRHRLRDPRRLGL